MNKRAMLLSVFLAVASLTSFVPQAAADHDKHYRRYGRFDSAYDRCEAGAQQRIRKDRALIRQWEGTGRHQKVVRWAHEDLAKVRGDLERCRAQARGDRYDRYGRYDRYDRYDPYYDDRDVAYDPRYEDRYDPYYGDRDRDFDFKKDWPLVLGTVLGAQIGR